MIVSSAKWSVFLVLLTHLRWQFFPFWGCSGTTSLLSFGRVKSFASCSRSCIGSLLCHELNSVSSLHVPRVLSYLGLTVSVGSELALPFRKSVIGLVYTFCSDCASTQRNCCFSMVPFRDGIDESLPMHGGGWPWLKPSKTTPNGEICSGNC